MRKNVKKRKEHVLSDKVLLVAIITMFISVLVSTYAYFFYARSKKDVIKGDIATVNLKLDVERIFPIKESNGVMVPQKSISGSSTSPLSLALKRGCVDDNKNVVCQVYSITIKNDGGTAREVVDGFVSFYANQELTENSVTKMPNLKWKLITSVDINNSNNSILGANMDNIATSNSNKFVSDVTLATNDSNTYYMIVWFNEIGDDQIDKGNTFYGKVVFNSSNGTGVTASF